MTDPGLVRALGLFGPALAAWGLWLWRKPDRRLATGALLACAWSVPALTLIQAAAARFGWWRFEARGGLFLGMPVDLLVGWALLWGLVPALAAPRLPLPLLVAVAAWLDVVVMPAGFPVVRLGPHWLLGEAAALALVLVPSQLLARWTWRDTHLPGRALLQVVAFSGLLVGVLPAVILAETGGSWRPFLGRPFWLNSLLAQLLALPAIVGLSAVQEFVEGGRGTPVPYDPPARLVTSGAYAYLANPMQVSMSLVLLGWGLMLESAWVAAAGLMAVAYSAGLAAWDEGADLRDRHGAEWVRYRKAVRPWLPRWRPYVASPVRLYVAEACGPCSELAQWIDTQAPLGLVRVAAEDHPRRDLARITYDPCDGTQEEEGVAALARALEHIHLGWAVAGWTMRLPVVRPLLQLIVDAAGGGPTRIIREAGRGSE